MRVVEVVVVVVVVGVVVVVIVVVVVVVVVVVAVAEVRVVEVVVLVVEVGGGGKGGRKRGGKGGMGGKGGQGRGGGRGGGVGVRGRVEGVGRGVGGAAEFAASALRVLHEKRCCRPPRPPLTSNSRGIWGLKEGRRGGFTSESSNTPPGSADRPLISFHVTRNLKIHRRAILSCCGVDNTPAVASWRFLTISRSSFLSSTCEALQPGRSKR